MSSALETEAGEKAAKEEAAAAAVVVENTTPDYAAGLVSAQVLYSTAFKHCLKLLPLCVTQFFSDHRN